MKSIVQDHVLWALRLSWIIHCMSKDQTGIKWDWTEIESVENSLDLSFVIIASTTSLLRSLNPVQDGHFDTPFNWCYTVWNATRTVWQWLAEITSGLQSVRQVVWHLIAVCTDRYMWRWRGTPTNPKHCKDWRIIIHQNLGSNQLQEFYFKNISRAGFLNILNINKHTMENTEYPQENMLWKCFSKVDWIPQFG